MTCPICELVIDPNSQKSVQIGNTFFHADCISAMRKEADNQHKTLTFVWEGDDRQICSRVYMSPLMR